MYHASSSIMYANVDDLSHLEGPLTEDILIKVLHARYQNHLHHVSGHFCAIKHTSHIQILL